MITTILCIQDDSNYKLIPGLDLWDKQRDAWNYNGGNPVIAHPPCQQWSKLKPFAHHNQKEKDLAIHCVEIIKRNGGILEHPQGSELFKYMGIRPTLSIDQSWWGFPARKTTYLYFKGFKPKAIPLTMTPPHRTIQSMDKRHRSKMPLSLCKWLTDHEPG